MHLERSVKPALTLAEPASAPGSSQNRRWVRAVTRALALGAFLAGFGSANAAPPESAAPSNSSATFTSIPIPGGTIFLFSPTVGPDGNIWFPMARPASIVRVLSHPPYTVTEFPLADEDSYPDGNMVVGPDGNLWFAEQGESVVHRRFRTGRQPHRTALAARPEQHYALSGVNDRYEPRSPGHHHRPGRQAVLCHGV